MSAIAAEIPGAAPESLVYPNEKRLFAVALVFSVLAWLALVVGTLGIALVYGLLAFVFYLFVQSALISHLQGTATRITAEQFPDLHRRIRDACVRLGVDPVPEAFLLHGNGVFNAFATRFLGRNFVVLMSDVVDALEAEPGAVDFYIGHELGHIRRNHIKWATVLLPASLLPLLGAAYSRAREYTCDLHGLAACASPALAAKGLAALAAGGNRWKTLDAVRYAGQAQASGGFWMSFHELTASYPWLTKRMARILGREAAPLPRRHFFAWVLAAFVPRLSVAGGGASLMVTVAMIGVLAAIAIPAYQDYNARARMAAVLVDGDHAAAAVGRFYEEKGSLPESLRATGFMATSPLLQSIDMSEKGVIRMQLAFAPVQGRTLYLVPSLDAEKHVVWRCVGDRIPPRYLPPRCRG